MCLQAVWALRLLLRRLLLLFLLVQLLLPLLQPERTPVPALHCLQVLAGWCLSALRESLTSPHKPLRP